MHLSWSMVERPLSQTMAFLGQTSMQGCARQPWHISETLTIFSGQRLQANLITLTSGEPIVLIRNGRIFQAGNNAVVLVHTAGGQTDGQAHPLLDDGALQEDILTEGAFLTGDDGVGILRIIWLACSPLTLA